MAWMFAGVQDDLTVGMHMHYHFLYAPPFPPTPFYPHPAIGMLRDKFARKTKIDNKKAARTGTKSKVMMPPHLPYIGPFTHGMPMENTGVQVAWMGAGMGVHPFGGTGFVVIEGKPAAGFLSNMLGCWCIAPGFDMKVPFVGLDFIMVPGFRLPTVLYGPAPLALDLFVLLLSIIEDLLSHLIDKIPIPWLREIAEVAKNALMTGLETAVEAWEQGVRPISACLLKGARFMGYAFVDGMVSWGLGKVLGLGVKKLESTRLLKWAKGSKIGGFVTDVVLDAGKSFIQVEANALVKDAMNSWTDGEYGEYYADKLGSKAEFGLGSILEAGAVGWSKHANTEAQNRFAAVYKANLMNNSINQRGQPGGIQGPDAYRDLNRNILRDSKDPAWRRRDDAFRRSFNEHGPGGMSGFHGVKPDTSAASKYWDHDGKDVIVDGMKKGGREVLDKIREKTMGEMFDEFTEGLFGDEEELGEAGDAARKAFAKTLAKRLFKL